MKQLYLTDDQNAAFDQDYHSKKELDQKVSVIKKQWEHGARILDLGGGNGRFIDALLDGVPGSRGIMIEISSILAGRNSRREDKTVIVGDMADLELHLRDHGLFDVITINWVLHHLVSDTYSECKGNCVETLSTLSKWLAPGGCIIVTENFFNGFFGSNVPSWIIFKITRIQRPYFVVSMLKRFFNTAGVGVCFRSENSWKDVVRQSGLLMQHVFYGDYWTNRAFKKMLLTALFLHTLRHGHMYCFPMQTSLQPAGGDRVARVTKF